ncbi:hypothetical protein JZ751_011077 [Albula glossodonta]|uniref:Regulator of microtubule dynamics protein 2 n=1 Tax=Albula glossodonta TaxID=121402 RepID=A0A8T2P6X9_9TELE|nr:hypothetical protein JZ751_011077 [Albula glossodonta]
MPEEQETELGGISTGGMGHVGGGDCSQEQQEAGTDNEDPEKLGPPSSALPHRSLYMTAQTDTEEEEVGEGGKAEAELEGDIGEEKDNLMVLLEQVDSLHDGSESEKKEGLTLLLEKKEEFGQKTPFLWRLMRAYADAHDVASNVDEKKSCAATALERVSTLPVTLACRPSIAS